MATTQSPHHHHNRATPQKGAPQSVKSALTLVLWKCIHETTGIICPKPSRGKSKPTTGSSKLLTPSTALGSLSPVFSSEGHPRPTPKSPPKLLSPELTGDLSSSDDEDYVDSLQIMEHECRVQINDFESRLARSKEVEKVRSPCNHRSIYQTVMSHHISRRLASLPETSDSAHPELVMEPRGRNASRAGRDDSRKS